MPAQLAAPDRQRRQPAALAAVDPCAPMGRRGSATRSIGRRAIDASPDSTVSQSSAGGPPGQETDAGPGVADVDDRVRLVQAPGPPSMTTSAGRGPATRPPRRPGWPRGCGHVEPVDRPASRDRPSARAASSRARWEIDLSPGTRSRPCRPPRRGCRRRTSRHEPSRRTEQRNCRWCRRVADLLAWPPHRPPAPARPGRLRRCGRFRGRRC